MAGVKISALPTVVSALLTDEVPAVQAGVTSRETWTQILSLFESNIQITAANVTGLTNGQLLIGNTGNPATASTLTAGSNISITNAAGAIIIAATGIASFSYQVITGNTQTLVSNVGYITNSTDTLIVNYTLPTTIAVGNILEIVGQSAGGWALHQNASQVIHLDSSSTTIGAGGSLATTARYQSIKLVCTVANTEFAVLSVTGTLTIV